MSGKAKNITAIIIAVVAILAVVAVTVLSSIVIRPVTYANGWMSDMETVEIYHSSAEGHILHSGGVDSALIEGDGEYASLKDPYTVSDLFDMTEFSLISACLQFNYSFGLGLDDDSSVSANEMTASEMSSKYSELTSGTALGYSFVIRLAESSDPAAARVMELTDSRGRKCSQRYDTIMFTVNQDSDWVRNITAYAFEWTDVFGEGLQNGTYYRLSFGLRTSAMLDVLQGVYNYDPFPEEQEETEEETDTETDSGTETTTETAS